MIYLARPAEPEALALKRAEWTQRWIEIRQARDGRPWATDAARVVLREPLLAFSFGKCAYCEGRLGGQVYLEVDHYHAKTVQPELVFHWPNLFPACQICYQAKGERDHGGQILKPDEDDPEQFFWVHPDTGELQFDPRLTIEQRNRATATIETLDLQRPELCADRVKTMERVERWLERARREHLLPEGFSPETKRDWDDFEDPKTEFKLVIRHIFRLATSPSP